MKILIVGLNYAPEPTGIAPYTTRLAERLVQRGHDVEVLTGYPHYPEWKLRGGYTGWRRIETINGVLVRRVRHYIPNKATALRRICLELSFGVQVLLARWNRPDVVLLVSPALFASIFALVRARWGLYRPRTALWLQDLYSRGLEEMNQGSSLSARGMRILEGFACRCATRVTVIHERFKCYVTEDLGVPDDNVSVIRNWTHLNQLDAFDREAHRARWGWKDTDVVVLHAGNMGVKQALENVVEAAKIADARQSKVRFVLLGDGNQRTRIGRLAQGVSRIDLIDPLPDNEFTRTMRAADILLVNEMQGLREMAVPSKLTSYFKSGLPVLAATEQDSATADEIASSKAGIRVDPGSPAALVAAAEELGSMRQRMRDLGRAGSIYAKTVLSEDTAIVQYEDLCRTIAADGRS